MGATRAESLAYFASRPFGSRLGAWVSQQSTVISSRRILELKWEEMKRRFAAGVRVLAGPREPPARSLSLSARRREGWAIERLAP